MNKFLINFIYFLIPLLIYGLFIFFIQCYDPFKIYKTYDNYYENNIVDLNREHVCLNLYKKNKKKKYNSFIFGNSRSLAFRIVEWEKFIEKPFKGFHFDATGEGIYGIYNKLNYLIESKSNVKNALIILDYSTLITTSNRKGHLSISHPELSGESLLSFYKEFLSASANWGFLNEFYSYKLFNNYNEKNKYIFPELNKRLKSNNITADVFFQTENEINLNKESYYKKMTLNGVFYDRCIVVNNEIKVSDKEKDILLKIKMILNQEKTSYKIIISPLYDQKKISSERFMLLNKIFGEEHVFDFSGINTFTSSKYNYYESSHYRPHVANEIMQIIFNKN